MQVRLATAEDLPAVTRIYNAAIDEHTTADTEHVSLASRERWLAAHPPDRYPILVAENAGLIAGYASLSAYRPGRGATRHTAEISYYVDVDHRRRGVGRALVGECIRRCPALGLRALFAIILDDNTASVRLLESFGFTRWGHLPGVARFGDRTLGHVYYGRRVDDAPA